jgi:restriction system protein
MTSAAYPVTPTTVDGISLIDTNNSAGANVVDPLVDKNTQCLQQIVREHAHELTIRRRQLTTPVDDGGFEDSSWPKEVDFFIDQIIEPQADCTKNSVERNTQVRQMIETATAHYSSSRVCFSLDRDPLPFEHLVADALADLGWKTCFVNGQGDRGLDVIAGMREKRVVIQCRYSASALGHSVILEAYAGKAFDTDYVAIVSNAAFTSNARRQAASTRVILLHHDELTQLEERIFGTDTWRRIAPRM